MKPTGFQEATAQRIVEVFREEKQNHVLLADEVGLGKTIVAREVIRRVSAWHKQEGDDYFKVLYICSNINIAQQNYRKLGIAEQDCLDITESRLSMQHLHIHETAVSEHNYQQLIPMTPATSFSMEKSQGTKQERALMFAVLERYPYFKKKQKELRIILRSASKLNGWKDAISKYEERIKSCEKINRYYLPDMMAGLDRQFEADPGLKKLILDLCSSNLYQQSEATHHKILNAVNRLRKVFAQISLNQLEPDLVIMDEFQRFNYLISAKDDETGMLTNKFLHDRKTKVLLLSATPYKPYSTLEELAEGEGDHSAEFEAVMSFLLNSKEKQQEFHTVWSDYSQHLSQLKAEDFTILIAKKNLAEDAMYHVMCRTERVNDALIDRSKAAEVEISEGDIRSYAEIQHLMDRLHLGNFPIEYVKSAPYLLSFMNYKVSKEIRAALIKDEDIRYVHNHTTTLLLRRHQINNYSKIPWNNARLEMLMKEVFSQGDKKGAELMLWIPASRPYYITHNVFSENAGYSKTLVFSSREMVPRMIEGLVSYEAERRTIGYGRNNDRKYLAEEGEKRNVSRRIREETKEILIYPCRYLAELYEPTEFMDQELQTVIAKLADTIRGDLESLQQKTGFSYAENGGAAQMLALLKAFDGNENSGLRIVSRNAPELLAQIAVGGPAECAFRLLKSTDYAKGIADQFVSLFNQPEVMAALDVLYPDHDYYENVFRYCTAGNLQAVLDEYAFTLGTSQEEELYTGMMGAFIRTAATPIETRDSMFGGYKQIRLRTHFAVGYYNAQISEDKVRRTESVRRAFNSPFRPFVMATTSIGQEGLDFHTYCRKLVHWNLPSNPIDLEQREGRINRYLGLAIRQNLGESQYAKQPFEGPVWPTVMNRASADLSDDGSGMIPYWCLPKDFPYTKKIEEIIPMYPFSKDVLRYKRLLGVLEYYRLTMGQPRQEELAELLEDLHLSEDQIRKMLINLSPYVHKYHI